MFETVWLCIAAFLLQSCRASPTTENRTTCGDFGKNVTFNPQFALGKWTTVYAWDDQIVANLTETSTISELTPSQLEEYNKTLENYPLETFKLIFNITSVSAARIEELITVVISDDETGDMSAWVISLKRGSQVFQSSYFVEYSMRLKSADEFLVMMLCQNKRIYILSKTNPVDRAKLQRVAADLHIEGVEGWNVYPYVSPP